MPLVNVKLCLVFYLMMLLYVIKDNVTIKQKVLSSCLIHQDDKSEKGAKNKYNT